MLYLVTYDLRKPGRDYGALAKTLERLGGVRVLASAWLVAGTLDSLSIYNRVAADTCLDGDDGILVTELTGSAAWDRLLIDDANVKRLLNARRGR